MYYQIQLVSDRQKSVRITSELISVPGQGMEFDSVMIQQGTGRVSFFVPVGRGEALAEALREAVK